MSGSTPHYFALFLLPAPVIYSHKVLMYHQQHPLLELRSYVQLKPEAELFLATHRRAVTINYMGFRAEGWFLGLGQILVPIYSLDTKEFNQRRLLGGLQKAPLDGGVHCKYIQD